MSCRLICVFFFCACWNLQAQETEYARLGILLDTSSKMGILVPQARKEIRLLNETLEKAGRPTVVVKEFDGANLGRAGGFSLAASRNAVFAIQDFFEKDKVDGVYWISALSGQQSGDGFFLLEEILKKPGEGVSGERQLIIRNIWQEQIQSGSDWIEMIPDPEADPLDRHNFPGEWFSAAKAGNGWVVRSWRLPPEEYRNQFGFPSELRHRSILRELNSAGTGKITMDQTWRMSLFSRYGLQFQLPKERWIDRFLGRGFVSSVTLVPFLDEESRAVRDEIVFSEMAERPTIDEDLEQIGEGKIGVLFGIGYLHRDLERFRSMKNRPIRDWRMTYVKDLSRIVGETRSHIASGEANPHRVYVSEMVDLSQPALRFAEPERYARRMAELVRKEKVEAIYFFTNGYTGGGEYGTFEVATSLIAAAIREANVRLYVRVPFEFGAVPIDLQKLALASGGGVFLGEAGDEDWQISIPKPAWPKSEEDGVE